MSDKKDVLVVDGEVYQRNVPFTKEDVKKDVKLLDEKIFNNVDLSSLDEEDARFVKYIVSVLETYKHKYSKEIHETVYNKYVEEKKIPKDEKHLSPELVDHFIYDLEDIFTEFLNKKGNEFKKRFKGYMVLDRNTFQPIMSIMSKNKDILKLGEMKITESKSE